MLGDSLRVPGSLHTRILCIIDLVGHIFITIGAVLRHFDKDHSVNRAALKYVGGDGEAETRIFQILILEIIRDCAPFFSVMTLEDLVPNLDIQRSQRRALGQIRRPSAEAKLIALAQIKVHQLCIWLCHVVAVINPEVIRRILQWLHWQIGKILIHCAGICLTQGINFFKLFLPVLRNSHKLYLVKIDFFKTDPRNLHGLYASS